MVIFRNDPFGRAARRAVAFERRSVALIYLLSALFVVLFALEAARADTTATDGFPGWGARRSADSSSTVVPSSASPPVGAWR